ncbi:MAG: hypothetical protein ACLFTY_02170 [Candidatus Aenigmatarchaeota archaeon]
MPNKPDAILSVKMCGENNHSSYNPNHPLKRGLYDYIDKEFDSLGMYEVAVIGTGSNPNYAKEISKKMEVEDKDNIEIKAIDPELVPSNRYLFDVVPETYQKYYGLNGKSDSGEELARHVSETLRPGFFALEMCNHQNNDKKIKEIGELLSSNGYSVENRGYFPKGSLIACKNC